MQSEKHNYFINKYKSLFQQFAEEPPADVFENISDALDIDEAWEGVSTTLDREDRVKRIKRIIRNAVALLLLLISIGGVGLLITNYKSNKYFTSDEEVEKVVVAKNDASTNPAPDNSVKKNYKLSVLNTEKGEINDKHIDLDEPNNSNEVTKQNQTYNPVETKNNSTIQNINPAEKALEEEPIEVESKEVIFGKDNPEIANNINNIVAQNTVKIDNNNDIKVSYIEPVQIFEIEGENKKDSLTVENNFSSNDIYVSEFPDQKTFLLPRGYYTGVTVSLNNIWMLNHDTYRGLRKNELDNTNVTIGKSYGLLAGYNFSDKWSGQVDWFIHAARGQKYTIFEKGRQYVEDIRLNYMQWNVVGKYKRPRIGQFMGANPISLNIVLGPYFSILRTTEENHYSKNDYGFHLDYEYELYLKKFIFSLALQGDFGLKNIFTGTEIIPSHFNKTGNLTLGVNMGIKYFISQK